MMLAQLKEQFGDCKFAQVSDCEGSYQHINEPVFYVHDPPPEEKNPVRIVNGTEVYQLTVKNDDTTEICLVRVDRCLFTNDVSKCDCILFNDDKFFLVEIKDTNSGGRSEKRKKAIKQLAATVEQLQSKNINFGEYNIHAVICFKRKEETTRIPNTAFENEREKFRIKYEAELHETNTIKF